MAEPEVNEQNKQEESASLSAKALSSEPTQDQIQASGSNRERFNFSAASYTNNTPQIAEEKKRKERMQQAIALSTAEIQAQISQDMQEYIDTTFGKKMADLEKNWDTIPKEKRDETIDGMIDDSAKEKQRLRKEKGLEPESRIEGKISAAKDLEKNAKNKGHEKVATALHKRIGELTAERDLAQHNFAKLSAKRTSGQKLLEGDKLDEFLRENDIETEDLTPSEKDIALIEITAEKQLTASKMLLTNMEETLVDLEAEIKKLGGTTPAKFIEESITQQEILKTAIEQQKFTVEFQSAITETIYLNKESWEGFTQDQITEDMMGSLLHDNPEIMYEIMNNEDFKKSIIDAAKDVGIEDTSKIEDTFAMMEETIAISRETLKTIGNQSRHEFLRAHEREIAVLDEQDRLLQDASNPLIAKLTHQSALPNSSSVAAASRSQISRIPKLLTYPEGENGNAVYESKELGLYYVRKGEDDNIERVQYTNPLEIAKINMLAYNGSPPRYFANELRAEYTDQLKGKGIDPKNTQRDTWGRGGDNKDARAGTIVAQINEQITATEAPPAPEAKTPDLKADFTTAKNQKPPADTPTNNFGDAAKNNVTSSSYLEKLSKLGTPKEEEPKAQMSIAPTNAPSSEFSTGSNNP